MWVKHIPCELNLSCINIRQFVTASLTMSCESAALSKYILYNTMYGHQGLKLPKQAENTTHCGEGNTDVNTWMSREKEEHLVELGQQIFFFLMTRFLAEEKVRKSLLCPNR